METYAEYLARTQKEQQSKTAAQAGIVVGATDMSPDQAAADLTLAQEYARSTGKQQPPLPMVGEHRSVFQQEIENKKNSTILAGNPKLSEWLRDPTNAAVSRDSVEELSFFEQYVAQPFRTTAEEITMSNPVTRAIARDTARITAIDDVMAGQGRAALAADIGKTREQLYQEQLAKLGENPGLDQQGWALRYAQDRYDFISGLSEEDKGEMLEQSRVAFQTAREIIDRAQSIQMSETASRFRDVGLANAENSIGGFFSAVGEDPTGAIAFVLETAAESIPSLAVATGATLIGGPAAGAATMGVTSAVRENATEVDQFFREKGVDFSDPQAAFAILQNPEIMREAQSRGLTRGAIIGIFDAISGGVAGQTLSKSPIGNMLLQGLTQAVLGSGGEAAAQAANGDTLSWADIIIEGLAELATAPLEVAGVGGQMFADRAKKADEARKTQERITGFVDAAMQAKVRERAPDAFRDYLTRTLDGKDAETMYVPADRFTEYFQSVGMNVEEVIAQLDGVDPNQVAEALATGGDIAIPTATFAAKIAGSEHDQFLLQNARFNPDDMTFAEAEEWEATKATLLDEAMQQADVIRAQAEVEVAAGQAVFDTMAERLTQSGQDATVARQQAAIWRSWYETRAARSGKSVAELTAAIPLPEVRGPGQQRPQAQAQADVTEGGLYDQTGRAAVDSEPFKQWFGKSAVVDDQGAPLVVHHGTPGKAFDTFNPDAVGKTSVLGMAFDTKRQGFYFAEKKGFAEGFAGQDGRRSGEVMSVYLSINNPLDVTSTDNVSVARLDEVIAKAMELDPEINNPDFMRRSGYDNFWELLDDEEGGEVFVRAMKELGYDGIKMIEPDMETFDRDYVPDDTGAVTWVAFDPTQIKSVNNRGTFDRSSPNILEQDGVPLFDRPLTIDGKVTIRAVGEAMTADHMAKHGRQFFPEDSEEDYKAVLSWAAGEVATQLQHPNSGVGWYSADVQLSMELAAQVYPTLATNPTHRDLYLVFAGLFSNGAEPEGAFMNSAEAFETFLATGEIPVNRAEAFRARGEEPRQTSYKDRTTGEQVNKDAGWGIRNPANEQQLAFVKYIFEREGGVDAGINWLRSKQPRTEINRAMTESGLYKAGRYTTKAEIAGDDAYGIMAFGEKLGRYTMGLHGVDIDAGDTTIDLWYSRTYRRLTGRLLETPIGAEGVVSGPTDQDRKVIFRMTGDLVKQFDLPAGDIQAVLWFWEKRLWGAQGVRTSEGTNSSGARKLLRAKGLDDGTGSDGQGDGAGGQAAGREYAQAGYGDGAGRYSGGGLAPLAGAPTVEGASGPDPRLVAVAEKYAADNGIPLQRQATFVEVDAERATRIAAAYDAMEHAPNDPRVKEAFENLIEQTKAQYQALADAGYQFFFIDPENDLYEGNPWNAMRDLRANQRMAVFPTEAGFGSGATDTDISGNPMEVDTGLEWAFGAPDGPKKRVLANDLFRAVHDAFGHGLEGAGFRARGEENAWQAHVRLFTGSAVAAITTETRGQNSWLNYGPHGETNRNAKVEDTVFADQKTGLLPEWAWLEGRALDEAPVVDERGHRYIEDRPQLPIGSDGLVELTHWSSEQRDVIDPKMGGTGPLVGPDRRAMRKWSFFGIDARTSRSQPGRGYIKENGLGNWRHTVKVDPARLYPWYEDPDGIKERMPRTSRYNVDAYAAAIQKAGYLGHYVTDDGEGSAVHGLAAAIYEPLPVDRASEDAQMSEADQARPTLLFQNSRGSIMFPSGGMAKGETIINLFKAADLSTFMHESGHFFLTALQEMAAKGDTSAQQEFDTIKAWWSSNAADVAKDASRVTGVAVTAEDVTRAITLGSSGNPAKDIAIDVGMQEQWARAFETYLMEGKAPSVELRGAFERFADWLKSVYKSLTSLNVKVSPELKGVFDRMLATDQQIEAAKKKEADLGPLFKTAAEMGLSDEEYEKYKALAQQAEDEATGKLRAEIMAPIQRAQQQWWRDERAKLVESLTAEKQKQPIYRAIQEMRFGQTFEGDETPGIKLNRKALEDGYGADILARLPGAPKTGKGHRWAVYATGEGGMHPDVVAEMYGFGNGRELVEALTTTPKLDDAVEAEADALMTQRHGDILLDGKAAQAAMDAIKGDKKARLISMELAALNAKLEGDRGLRRSLLFPKVSQFREMARRTLDRMVIKDARAAQRYVAASRKASDDAYKALAKGDIRTAAEAKRRHLLSHMMYMEARKIDAEVEKLVNRLSRLNRADSTQARGVDVDHIRAARAIAAKFGLANGDSQFDFDAWSAQLQQDDPATYAALSHAIQTYTQNAKPFKALTVGEFRAVADAVANLVSLGKTARTLEIEGQQMAKDQIIAELSDVLAQRGLKQNPALKARLTAAQRMGKSALSMLSALRRVEAWARDMDDGDQGPFTRYLVRPVMDALGVYRDEKAKRLDQMLAILNPRRKDLLSGGSIAAPELGYTFETKAELIHAILHTGNESNKEKLLMGRGWSTGLINQQQKTTPTGKPSVDRKGQPIMDRGTVDTSKWDVFITRMVKEGKLTKEDFDMAQSIWDLMEELKRPAQTAHRKMFGFYFGEVEASPVVTPFGTYRGGYVPAIADQDASNDGQIRADQNALEMQQTSFMFPTTGSGFTKARVEQYRTPLALDLMLLPAHMDKVLRFTHVEPTIRQTAGIITARDMREAMDTYDQSLIASMLTPWLQRTAQQAVEQRATTPAGRAFSNIARELRRRVGIHTMFMNVVNTAQQITGFSTAMVLVKPYRMSAALARYTAGGAFSMRAEAMAQSAFMRERVGNAARETQRRIQEAVVKPTIPSEMRALIDKHGYVLQQFTQNIMDVMIWHAAYDQAIAKRMSEADAVFEADSVVRRTIGDFAPENLSLFETGNAFTRLFTMFYSYFNGQANLVGGEMKTAMRTMGWRGSPRMFWVYLMGIAAPAIIADLIVRGFQGDLEDEDDDGYADEIAAITLGSQGRYITAMVPVAGQVTMAMMNRFNDMVYDDRLSTSPVVSTVERASGAPASIAKAVQTGEGERRAVMDGLTLLALITGIPMGQLAKMTGYAMDVSSGDAQPQGPADVVQGLTSGKDGTKQ